MQKQHLVPIVIEKEDRAERAYDIYSRLLKDRIVFVTGPLDDDTANLTVAQMLFLSRENPKADVNIYINSPGGSVTAGLAIYDTMQFLRCQVATYCLGLAASMGALLLAAGAKGKRSALPHSRVMIHQPLGGAQGKASDIEIQANEILTLRAKLNKILSEHTGQTINRIEKDSERNFFMSPEESKKYGIIDEILVKTTKPSKKKK